MIEIDKERIEKYSKNFTDWLANRADKDEILDMLQIEGNEISENLYDFYGDYLSGVKIPVSELKGFGTQCGRKDNTCFNESILYFLNAGGIQYVISSVFHNEPNKLGHCLIPLKSVKDANLFEKYIGNCGGSLTNGGNLNDELFFFETE